MPPSETIHCPQCGMEYDYDEQRRCWACDGPSCPHCLPEDLEPLCPECRFGDLPAHIEPMLAKLGSIPSTPEQWGFEYKWDGMRALLYWDAGTARLESRNLNDVTHRYPDLIPKPDQMPEQNLILDGEIIATDAKGRPSFQRLQKRMHVRGANRIKAAMSRVPVQFYVFDVLWAGGRSTAEEPYTRRREILEALELDHPRWRIPAWHAQQGRAMLRVAEQWGLEGLVAKRLDSIYRPGARSSEWTKIKIVKRQEFVVGGWEPREKDDRQIGSLLVGYYDPEAMGLQFAGRVGTGFDAATHEMLVHNLTRLERTECPFEDPPGGPTARYVAPQLVAEVDYRRWPDGGNLQQASFLGLREDIPAGEVILEKVR
ncbi:MAG: non-homologous end-joining DNA ligase [Phycisphaerae bacterium]